MHRVPPRNSKSRNRSAVRPSPSFALVAPPEERPEQLLQVKAAHLEVVEAAAEEAEQHEE